MLLFLTLIFVPPATAWGDELPAVAEPDETEVTTADAPSADHSNSPPLSTMTLADFEQIAFRHHRRARRNCPAGSAATTEIAPALRQN